MKDPIDVSSSSNAFKNCYSGNKAGGLYIENSVYTDTSSTFTNLAGLEGGAIQLNKGTLALTGSTFTSTKGRNGGVINLLN